MKAKELTEAQLAEKLIQYIEGLGYESYKEVCMRGKGGDPVADIYFIKREGGVIIDSIIVETKIGLNMKVIEQADRWKTSGMSMKTYVCVIGTKRKEQKTRRFSIKVCKKLGIGVFQLINNTIIESAKPEIIYTDKTPPLYEDQKNSIAGNNRSEYVTDFKRTVNNLYDFMKDRTEYVWIDLISEINHHYSSDKSANNTLKKYIDSSGRFDLIKGFRFEKKDKKIYLVKC